MDPTIILLVLVGGGLYLLNQTQGLTNQNGGTGSGGVNVSVNTGGQTPAQQKQQQPKGGSLGGGGGSSGGGSGGGGSGSSPKETDPLDPSGDPTATATEATGVTSSENPTTIGETLAAQDAFNAAPGLGPVAGAADSAATEAANYVAAQTDPSLASEDYGYGYGEDSSSSDDSSD